jgi:outer membrane biosynthesis protein TonB
MRAFEQRKKNASTNSSDSIFFSAKIQKKLKTGTPGDQFEVEADTVADKVVNNNSSGGLLQSKSEEEVQQKPISETISSVQGKEMKEEEPVQKKSEEKEEPVQKKEEKKEEEPVQKKSDEKEEAVQKKTEEKEEPVQKKEDKKEEEPVQKKTEEKEEVAQAKCAECEKEEKAQKKGNPSMDETQLKKGKGNPLDKKIKLEMENSFGVDFSAIRIHTDSNAVNLCQEMKAQAFTNGVDIYFNKGKYNPNSSEGKKLLAHELTHTVQQGAVKQKAKKDK